MGPDAMMRNAAGLSPHYPGEGHRMIFTPRTAGLWLLLCALCAPAAQADEAFTPPAVNGYRGIWYYNQPTKDEYVYKYSGGLGTYCAYHIPMAVYAPEVNKTFFVYGGDTGSGSLAEMVSYFDHSTGQVPQPRNLIDKKTDDAHDNPVLSIDDAGHLWVYASSHGTGRPSYIFKSTQPYSIEAFSMVLKTNFSYPQPWHIPGKGFLFLHTYYKAGRGLYWQRSADGIAWSERRPLAHMEEGHYQISWPRGEVVGTAFNMHPKGKGLNHRTNLYYMETADLGETWRTVDGTAVETPVTSRDSITLVKDYDSEGLKVYIQALNYDAQGRPIILYLLAKGWEPGPENGPRVWMAAHWTGAAWVFHEVTRSGSNYDTGSIIVEGNTWTIIGPTETGPQPYNPGGEMAIWTSTDAGATWTKTAQLTTQSVYNHTFARLPLRAHGGFQTFWADGHGRQPSPSRLYFWNAEEGRVYRLPYEMNGEYAAPELVAPQEGAKEE
jgi:hypothetical protein